MSPQTLPIAVTKGSSEFGACAWHGKTKEDPAGKAVIITVNPENPPDPLVPEDCCVCPPPPPVCAPPNFVNVIIQMESGGSDCAPEHLGGVPCNCGDISGSYSLTQVWIDPEDPLNQWRCAGYLATGPEMECYNYVSGSDPSDVGVPCGALYMWALVCCSGEFDAEGYPLFNVNVYIGLSGNHTCLYMTGGGSGQITSQGHVDIDMACYTCLGYGEATI